MGIIVLHFQPLRRTQAGRAVIRSSRCIALPARPSGLGPSSRRSIQRVLFQNNTALFFLGYDNFLSIQFHAAIGSMRLAHPSLTPYGFHASCHTRILRCLAPALVWIVLARWGYRRRIWQVSNPSPVPFWSTYPCLPMHSMHCYLRCSHHLASAARRIFEGELIQSGR
jgi:hypothetical protein